MKDKVLETLNDFLGRLCAHKDFTAEDFRLTADYNESLALGQKENELLGPYNMPSISKSLTATLYIRWLDKKISNVNLNYAGIMDFEKEIAGWREKSFIDEWAPAVWREETFDNNDALKYKMYDPEIARVVEGNAQFLFDAIKLIDSKLKPVSKLITVNAFASINRRFIFLGPSASNPVYDFKFSSAGIAFELDNQYSDSFIKRRMFTFADISALIDKAIKYYPAFSVQLDKKELLSRPAVKNIVLTPSVCESFVNKYILSNLYAKPVVEKQARFSLSDFTSQEKHFRDDISIKFEPDFDEYEINNIPLTYEGVQCAPVYFVKNGRLQTPILDLKYSKKAEMPPTAYLSHDTFQSSEYKIKIETGEYECVNNILEDMSEGFIIFDVLGMHTQDHTGGDFSISAPHAMVIHEGKPAGMVKLSISGNFFEILNHHNTKLLNWYGEGDSMALKCLCS